MGLNPARAPTSSVTHPVDAMTRMAQSIIRQRAEHRSRRLRAVTLSGTELIEPDGRRLINFSGNDYLGVVADGLADDFADGGFASESQVFATRNFSGATASSLVCGWSPAHARLAAAICRLEQTEAAVVFPSGYAACSGAIATLPQERDLILSDQLNHASLIDGCRASRATRVVVPHGDWNFADEFLRRRRGEFECVWIVTDSVFSMDGVTAPLGQCCDIADRHDAVMVVDEAHATGVLGESGGGCCESVGVRDRVLVRIGTLSKAIGCQGGFVAGPQVVIDYLIQFCRPLIYSTALCPAVASLAADVIERLPGMTERRDRVARHSRRIREGLNIATTNRSPDGLPIIPVILGCDETVILAADRVRDAGLAIPAIRPPTVPDGTARLRISVSAAHTDDQISTLITTLRQLGLTQKESR